MGKKKFKRLSPAEEEKYRTMRADAAVRVMKLSAMLEEQLRSVGIAPTTVSADLLEATNGFFTEVGRVPSR